jgi:hypothetical protein
MPIDPEIMQLVSEVSTKLVTDQHRPYRIRRKKPGEKTSKGDIVASVQYEYRTITNMRTQPLKTNEFNRLPEGMREKSWRFIMVVPEKIGDLPASPDEMMDFKDQIEYRNHWYEVQFINDWDLIQHAKAVFVE